MPRAQDAEGIHLVVDPRREPATLQHEKVRALAALFDTASTEFVPSFGSTPFTVHPVKSIASLAGEAAAGGAERVCFDAVIAGAASGAHR